MKLLAIAIVSGAAALAACSGQSAIAPSAAALTSEAQAPQGAPGVPGVYDLSFNAVRDGVLVPVSSLTVNDEELILTAHVVEQISGNPAQRGSVTFEYCSYGGRKNDITAPDEAPKEACDQGLASWARLRSIALDGGCPQLGTGYACMNFGIVQIPRDVGFRFRYTPQGSGIAAGTSESKNFTWVEAPI
jgi:hypothetical protein